MTTVLDFPAGLLASFDVPEIPALGVPVGELPDEFHAPAAEAAGQYRMYPGYLLPGDCVLVGSDTWMRVHDLVPVDEIHRIRYDVVGRGSEKYKATLSVRADRMVTVWHPVDVMISALLSETAGGAL